MTFVADTSHKILLIGAGELGAAFLPHLASLPNTYITLGIRTISKYTHLAGLNTSLLNLDISGPSPALSETFAKFDIVISCTGFGQDAGSITKLANEILEAGRLRKVAEREKLWFFPWQWGVDYDITGDGEGLMPLFGEQVEVRNLLRSKAEESNVKWTIVSTGIFMSFLFQQFWGVVDAQSESTVLRESITVRALRDWEHSVTVTDVNDIGKVLARIVVGDVESEDRVVYIAGDTVSYSELAEIIARVTGKEVQREEWTIPHLKEDLAKDPDNMIKKYRVVFAGDGVSWDKKLTVNHQLSIPVIDVETYARKHLGT
ncbi:NAD(P)-binding protein [Melanomma pulvis-pyrius CBS 109.77]|uniref:NAD(P)-binding protein n=1 Tax=Melanomma pulvis-pyrius CBS 109.77 TaxID=1314802 RepID=A0A6A6XWU4_9PLEO|nr:NAD(P)-binding protein [Melanomma pulvis-pyrius CBS 109.77]